MKTKYNKIVLTNIINLICIIFLHVAILLSIFNSIYTISLKKARNYALSDLASAQMINLGVKLPTLKDWEKYDINIDEKIDNVDVQIIQQMLLGYYDYYIVYK